MMIELLLPIYDFNLFYATRLTADVPDERLAEQPVVGRAMNHAAFTVGHLAWANSNGIKLLGGQPPAFTEEYKALCGMGVHPMEDRAKYPAKEALLASLTEAHAALAAAVRMTPAEKFAEPAPERMRARFPTVGHMIGGLMTSHYANHLGQLSAWRRAMGFASVF